MLIPNPHPVGAIPRLRPVSVSAEPCVLRECVRPPSQVTSNAGRLQESPLQVKMPQRPADQLETASISSLLSVVLDTEKLERPRNAPFLFLSYRLVRKTVVVLTNKLSQVLFQGVVLGDKPFPRRFR